MLVKACEEKPALIIKPITFAKKNKQSDYGGPKT